MVDSSNKYTKMQLKHYNKWGAEWSEENPDPVVGSFHKHNKCEYYENLFTRIENQRDKTVLDFGCGPGRNIVKYKGRFKRMDGVDISPINIRKAQQYIINNRIIAKLFVNNGVDLEGIESDSYDVVMSTITMQHICVYDIRFSLLREFYRVLKPGGIVTIQMGIGASTKKHGYYANSYGAKSTNGTYDVSIECPCQVKYDLVKIGFTDFDFVLTDVGVGKKGWRWIFFSAIKNPTWM